MKSNVAIVVSDLKKSINKYKNILGVETSDPIESVSYTHLTLPTKA